MATRPQYTTAKCGACGKKKAYMYRASMSYGTQYDVTCMACKAQQSFLDFPFEGLLKWPGSLEAAALLLKGKEAGGQS